MVSCAMVNIVQVYGVIQFVATNQSLVHDDMSYVIEQDGISILAYNCGLVCICLALIPYKFTV